MFDSSSISTMNVDRPPASSSSAPTRVKIPSTRPTVAVSAGTKLPTCASRAISAVWRMYVDFPDMFGPVTMRKVRSSSRYTSLGTNSVVCSTTG